MTPSVFSRKKQQDHFFILMVIDNTSFCDLEGKPTLKPEHQLSARLRMPSHHLEINQHDAALIRPHWLPSGTAYRMIYFGWKFKQTIYEEKKVWVWKIKWSPDEYWTEISLGWYTIWAHYTLVIAAYMKITELNCKKTVMPHLPHANIRANQHSDEYGYGGIH